MTTATAPVETRQGAIEAAGVTLADPLVRGLTTSLQVRFGATTDEAELERLVRIALGELMPVRVTAYLPVLVGRRVGQLLQANGFR